MKFYFFFFTGAGLRQERLSTQAGFCCPDKQNWFLEIGALNKTILNKGAINQQILAGSSQWACKGGSCGICATSILQMKQNEKSTFGDLLNEYSYLKDDFGSTKLDRSLSRYITCLTCLTCLTCHACLTHRTCLTCLTSFLTCLTSYYLSSYLLV